MPKTEHIRVSVRAWYALKRVQAYAPDYQRDNVKTFATLVDAILYGDDELLVLARKKMRETN